MCWLSDINIDHLIAEIGLSNKILIVDECRRSGSYGEGLMSSLYSKVKNKYDINLHAAADSFIPLGDAATSTLPNSQTITFNALQLYENA